MRSVAQPRSQKGLQHVHRPRPNVRAVAVRSTPASAALAATAAAALLLLPGAARAELSELLPFEGTFQVNCAACHINGGNIVQPGVTLFPQDLKRNGVDTPEAIYNIIYSGKNKMPGYGQNCQPRGKCTFGPRLTDEEIQGLTTFVQQKQWK